MRTAIPLTLDPLPPQALGWFEALLRERLHADVQLLRSAGGEHTMRIAGSDGRIVFPSAKPLGGEHGCVHWDPRSEGLHSVFDAPLPVPGGSAVEAPVMQSLDGGCAFAVDLPALVYWTLCRVEEIDAALRDRYDRFSAAASHAWRHGYLDRPFVDEWFDVLGQVMQRTWPALTLRPRTFSLRVSHDVDIPSRYARRPLRALARAVVQDVARGHIADVLRAPLIYFGSGASLHPADPANTFDWLMDRSEEIGMRSAFYFICGRTNRRMDAGYNPEDRAIRTLLRAIHARGHEIGLHPSFATYRAPGALATEADRLRRICREEGIEQQAWGGRMHYLRWEMPTTLRAWEAAGMAYDSTLGYADVAGFRCGTCLEYSAFDPVALEPCNLRIRPLVAMECTVMDAVYMGLGDGEAALAEFLRLKGICRRVGGSFTLLWHNSQLDTPALRDLYARVLSG